MAAPPAYDEVVASEAPPAFSDLPPAFDEYDSPPKPAINLVKEEAPPYEEPEQQRQHPGAGQQQEGQTTVIVANNSVNTAEIFHIVSMMCAVLSLVVFPLLELIPAIMFCLIPKEQLANPKPNAKMLHQLDFLVTALCFAILVTFLLIIALFTFGLGLILLVFAIPFLVVMLELSTFTPTQGNGLF